MKGKIAFVLGAAVGYVLGSRAGRARYEQIKRGAETVWNTPPVQQGVGFVRGKLDDATHEALAFVRRATADAFTNLVHRSEAPQQAGAERPKPVESTSSETPPASPSRARSVAGAGKTGESAAKTGGFAAKTQSSSKRQGSGKAKTPTAKTQTAKTQTAKTQAAETRASRAQAAKTSERAEDQDSEAGA